jgi:hypothetical protein
MEAIAKLKGGPLARLAGQLCGNPRFQAFMGASSADQAADYLRTRCRIDSRAELDHDQDAAQRFHQVRRAFVNRSGE